MKRHMYLLAVLAFCLVFSFIGKNVFAVEKETDAATATTQTTATKPKEVTLNKTPFIDTSNRLVLRFKNFADTGYQYVLTRTSDSRKYKGTLKAGENTLKIDLNAAKMYKKNATYTLVVTSADNTLKVTTRYYTGVTLTGLTVSRNDKNAIKAVWKTADKNNYTGYMMDTSRLVNYYKPLVRTHYTGKTGTTDESLLEDGKYYVSVTAYKQVGTKKYYGQMLTKSIDYKKALPKVTGLTVTVGTGKADLVWNPVKGAESYTVYMKAPSDSGYKAVKTGIKGTAYTAESLKGGSSYSFKVKAVSSKLPGTASSVVTAKIPAVAGKVAAISLKLNSSDELSVAWSKVSKASFYRVYYKEKGEGNKYAKLADATSCIQSLKKLDPKKTYQIIVYSFTKFEGKSYRTKSPSNTITVMPESYMKKNYYKLLAGKVRTITYYKTKCDYTTKKYNTSTKTAFVNYKGYSSPTKYLIWISHYTQQVSVFKGSKGNWEMIRTFVVGTGTAKNHSPRGIYKVKYKEKGWYYVNTKELYVTHWAGRNSFHTRPLYNGGGVATPTIGRPCSHGCVRCYNKDAKYIYDNMPLNTTVVSY